MHTFCLSFNTNLFLKKSYHAATRWYWLAFQGGQMNICPNVPIYHFANNIPPPPLPKIEMTLLNKTCDRLIVCSTKD